jgi:nitrate/TMAO reductase-like tetraheme cytochrome c subunit
LARSGKRLLPAGSWIAIAAVLVVVALAGAFVGAQATDSASFCATCHEMRPYNAAWAAGPHKSVQCVECHVAPGTLNRLAHKLVALDEVRVHLFGDPKFPMSGVAVPNDRCLRCHPNVQVKMSATSRFSHALHEKKAACWECHTTTGHSVALDALKAEGVLAPSAQPQPGAVAGTRAGQAIKGHVQTSCLRCHDQSKMACATCHKPPHKDRGPCLGCHRPGKAFTFVHPPTGACGDCHKKPAKHIATNAACNSCHRQAGRSWAFTHPSSTDCGACHQKPAKHVGTDAACPTCHRQTGKSWAFSHPARKDCTACHKAPASHFGNDCARCHSTTKPFTSTTFNHPATAHGWRSRPCASCHPKGPPAVSCTCHGGGTSGGD